MRAGFPHSEILGSKPVCGLPGAYRTLQRPSSPVIAKASTTCTYSLDPITAKPSNVTARELPVTGPSQRLSPSSLRIGTCTTNMVEIIIQTHDASISCEIEHWTSSEFLKNNSRLGSNNFRATFEQPPAETARRKRRVRRLLLVSPRQRRARPRVVLECGGGERNRTDDPLLAKQVLSQLSYTPRNSWWVWMDSNHRPPPYQDGALTS